MSMGVHFGDTGQFQLICVGVLAVIVLVASRFARGDRRGLLLWTVLVIAVSGLWTVGWGLNEVAVSRQEERLQELIEGMAPTYARELERLGHGAVTEETPAGDPRREVLAEARRRWLATNPRIVDAFTYRLGVDGEALVPVISGRSPIGVMGRPSAAVERALSGRVGLEEVVFRDLGGGHVILAYLPLFDAGGRVDGVLGLKYVADTYLAAVREARMYGIGLLTLLSLMGLSVILYVELQRRRLRDSRRECERVRHHRDWFRALFDHSPDAVFIQDEGGIVREANRRACELHRTTRERLVGRHVSTLVPERRREETLAIYPRLWSGELEVIEGMSLAEDGAEVPVEVRSSRVELAGRQHLLLHVRDVTEKVEFQRRLEEAQRRLVLHIDNSPLAFIEFDGEFRIKTWSRRAEQVFGWRAGEVLGRHVHDWRWVHEDDRQLVEREFERLSDRRIEQSVCRNRNYAGDGRTLECQWFITVERDETGRIVSYMCLVQDMTRIAELEVQLHQAQKMQSVGQLAAGVAHDFNNLLTVIQGHVAMLRNEGRLRLDARASVDEIGAAADRAAGLTRQLLTFSRRHAVHREAADLDAILDEMIRLLDRVLTETIELVFEPDGNLPLVAADCGLVEQIIMNLCVNARDAMPSGGRLVLRTFVREFDDAAARPHGAAPGPFVCLEVEDTGCGMPPEVLAQAFDPFFTTKDVGQGTGLGLATVYAVASQHDGWVTAESVVGKGTIFRLCLPAVAAGAPVPVPVRVPAPSVSTIAGVDERARGASDLDVFGRESVLLVEDEPALRTLACRNLEHFGYRVTCAANAVEALALWEHRQAEFAAVVTDLVMPEGVSGRELGERVRADRPELAVVFMSGYSRDVAGGRIPAGRGLRFLPKPYSPEALARALRESLDEMAVFAKAADTFGASGDKAARPGTSADGSDRRGRVGPLILPS